MLRQSSLALLLFLAGACEPTNRQLLRHHTEDGVRRYGQGAYGDARDCFQAALDLKPRDPDLTYNLARCYARLGQQDKAEPLFQDCLSLQPDHAEARHALLLLLIETGREADGRRMVADWMRTRPRQGGPYAEEAWLHARDGDLDKARERYQQALSLEPTNARALFELGSIYEKLGRPERALVLYDRSLDAKPDQPELVKLVSGMRARRVAPPRPD